MENNGKNMHWANLELFNKQDKSLLKVVGQNCLMRLKNEDWNGSNYILFYVAPNHIYNPYNKIMSNQEYLEWYIEFLNSIGFKCYFEGLRVVENYRNEVCGNISNPLKGVECFAIKIDQADFKGNRWPFFATWQSVRYIYSSYNTKTVETMFMLQKRFGQYLDNAVIYQIAHYIISRTTVNNTWSTIPRNCYTFVEFNKPQNKYGEYPVSYHDFVMRLKTKEIFAKDTTLGTLESVQQMFNTFNGDLKPINYNIPDSNNQVYRGFPGVVFDMDKNRGELVKNLLIKISKSVRTRIECINEILELLEYPGPKIEVSEKPKKVTSKKDAKQKQVA